MLRTISEYRRSSSSTIPNQTVAVGRPLLEEEIILILLSG
jgi:hypothetical protein